MADRPDGASPMWTRWPGLVAMFTGAALLAFLITDIPLPLMLVAWGLAAAVLAAALRSRSTPDLRRRIRRQVLAGLVAGVVGVVVYDAIRVGGASLDPSPYDPMEAIRGFGRALAGPDVPRETQLATGLVLHVVNGTLFGVGFVSLVGTRWMAPRRSWVVRGIAWALFLEVFQILLYPDWLGIVLVREFTVIATVAHVGYGVVLGLVARQILASSLWRKPWQV